MKRPELKDLPIESLQRGRFQPRQHFAEEELAELAQSIKMNGLIQPIVVRPISSTRFEIVAGERRWRAAQLAGLTDVSCLVNHYSDEQTAEVTAIENINRVDLNPIEEAQAYQRLIDEFHYTHDEIAAVIGKSRVKITNCLRLLKLAEPVRQLLIQGTLSEGHGKVLAGLELRIQCALAEKSVSQGWSIRQLERAVKQASQSNLNSENDANLQALARALTEHLACPVDVEYVDRKGKLSIAFHNLDILHGLFDKMGFDYSEL